MSGILKIKIAESEEQLHQLLRQVKKPQEKERIQVLYWVKTKQAETVNHLSTLIGRHRTTVSRWLSDYRANGIESLIKVGQSPGRPAAIAPEIMKRIEQELKDPEGFQSYIALMI
ncbi:MAG: helix-turn-helix domain-containing protein [Waterburya sp.]